MPIRKATNLETQQILDHSLEVLKESAMGFVKPSKEKALQMVSPFLANGGYYLVYVEKNNVKGWIGAGKSFDSYTDETIGFISEIYVLPLYRKQGIAEKLFEAVFRQFQTEGLRKVQLNVFSGNHARELYQKLGFQDVSMLMEKDL